MATAIDGAALRYELFERGCAELDHGTSQDQFEDLIHRDLDFTLNHPDPEPATMDAMLPEAPQGLHSTRWLDQIDFSKDKQKVWHKYRTNISSPGKPHGYTNRSYQEQALLETRGLDIAEDPKEFYHYAPGLPREIILQHERFGWGPIPPEVTSLNLAFRGIHAAATKLTMKVCRALEDVHPDIGKYITPDSLRKSPLRLLGYHPSDKPYLGEEHFDMAFWTLQWAETHKGLVVAPSPNSELVPVTRAPEKAVGFPGMQFSDPDLGIYPDSELRPTLHGIENKIEVNPGRNPLPERATGKIVRFALIYFARAEGFQPVSKSATHNKQVA